MDAPFPAQSLLHMLAVAGPVCCVCVHVRSWAGSTGRACWSLQACSCSARCCWTGREGEGSVPACIAGRDFCVVRLRQTGRGLLGLAVARATDRGDGDSGTGRDLMVGTWEVAAVRVPGLLFLVRFLRGSRAVVDRRPSTRSGRVAPAGTRHGER